MELHQRAFAWLLDKLGGIAVGAGLAAFSTWIHAWASGNPNLSGVMIGIGVSLVFTVIALVFGRPLSKASTPPDPVVRVASGFDEPAVRGIVMELIQKWVDERGGSAARDQIIEHLKQQHLLPAPSTAIDAMVAEAKVTFDVLPPAQKQAVKFIYRQPGSTFGEVVGLMEAAGLANPTELLADLRLKSVVHMGHSNKFYPAPNCEVVRAIEEKLKRA